MKEPDVITEWRHEELNFTFQVAAYRKVTEEEMYFALRYWLQKKRLKRLPKNGYGKVITIHGFDE